MLGEEPKRRREVERAKGGRRSKGFGFCWLLGEPHAEGNDKTKEKRKKKKKSPDVMTQAKSWQGTCGIGGAGDGRQGYREDVFRSRLRSPR